MACAGVQVLGPVSQRIDLAESGRVVEMPDTPSLESGSPDELIRGSEGWDAVRGDDGMFTIGVEWDEPREITEVNIEFRHAIANRELIKVQYWKEEPAAQDAAKRTDRSKPRGRWLTPETEWWAGDRDVSFAFLPGDRDGADKNKLKATVRRTTRLRFVCGKEDLPPVRYLRAYGPDASATDTFEFRFDEKSKLAPPVMVEAVDGFIMASDGKTKMGSAVLRDRAGSLLIRYAMTASESPNKTRIILSASDKPEDRTIVYPIEVARKGRLDLARDAITVERRGGILGASSQPVATMPAGTR